MHQRSRRQFFEAKILQLMDRLYGTALRLTRDRANAEDLVSEAVVQAWACLDQLQDDRNFDRWVLRILTNRFMTQWRRRERAPDKVSFDDGGVQSPDEEFSLFRKLHQPFLLWWGSPERAFLDKVLREDIERAIDNLPADFRVAVILVDVQGWSYAEVAESLSIPVGTVRSRLARGRALLQKALWEQARDHGLVADAQSAGKAT